MRRLYDILFSSILLFLLWPLFLIIGLLIKFTSNGPIFFTQMRIGKENELFKFYKFRTMKVGTPNVATEKLHTSKSYITSFGGILRRTSLDELPQLINILKGDMTFIGPRPALFNQYELKELRTQLGVHKLIPGITGWAQVNGRDMLDDVTKTYYDEEYLKNRSIGLDFKILFSTLFKVLKCIDIIEGESATIETRQVLTKIHSNIKPLVSIIIPTYKRCCSLEKALKSINIQTYRNFEVVVIDDNYDKIYSAKVKKIIENYKADFNINYIKNTINKGSAETRNIGIRASKGEYITFLDDDDIYFKNKIENQLNFMLNNELDYSITDLTLYSENNSFIEYRNRKYIKSTLPNDLFKYHLLNHITGTDTMMFKKEYLLSIGCFAPINLGDEFYLMERAINAGGKFGYLPKCDVKAYVHSDTNGLSSGDSKIIGENQLYEYKKNFFEKLNTKEIHYIKMRHYAVLAFAEARRKKHFNFIKYSIISFLNSPFDCIKLVLTLKLSIF